jgi:hypothetical protein
VFQLHDSLPVENRESNAFPALRHMILAKDERTVLANKVRKHASKDSTVKAWSCETKDKKLVKRETKWQAKHPLEKNDVPFNWRGVSRVHAISLHWSWSGSGDPFLS